MAETQAAAALAGVEMEGSDLASLLQKEFKPKSDDAKSAVEQAVQTNAVSKSEVSVHIAVARRETSTTEPRPVRSRFRSAPAMPKARPIAALRSPMAPRWLIG